MADEDTGFDPAAFVSGETQPEQKVDPNLAATRSSQAAELKQNPELARQIYSLTHNEVGKQGTEAHQAFMETLFNRAAARNTSIQATVNDTSYYPKVSYRPVNLNQDQVSGYGNTLLNVIGGSNISNGATGNASGKTGFAGGPHTFSAGGEKFGISVPTTTRLVQQIERRLERTTASKVSIASESFH